MGSFSFTHWIIVAIVVLVLFGRGRISETMGDFGKGMKAFKRGLSEDDQPQTHAPQQLPPSAPVPAAPTPGAHAEAEAERTGTHQA